MSYLGPHFKFQDLEKNGFVKKNFYAYVKRMSGYVLDKNGDLPFSQLTSEENVGQFRLAVGGRAVVGPLHEVHVIQIESTHMSVGY
jgi:hypothetical protein